MFRHKRRIFLRETDATGRIYFGAIIDLCVETFERFLHSIGQLDVVMKGDFLLPIVHFEGSCFHPLQVGDILEIGLRCSHIGETSFHLQCEMYNKNVLFTQGKTVHVMQNKQSKQKQKITKKLADIINRIK